jgi:hypothetical protein
MIGPGLVRGADEDGGGAHQPGTAIERGEVAVADREEERLAAHIDATLDRQPAAAAQQVGVGSQQAGQGSEAVRRAHTTRSARSFFIASGA